MEFDEFKEMLKSHFQKQEIELTEEKSRKFYEYMDALVGWNKKINLTAITEPKEIIIKHFYDSVTVYKYIKNGSKVIDVGTGAGFPGVPLKIVNNSIELTLLDSLNKRIVFLEELKNIINIKDIETIHGRAEDFGQDKNFREKYDICISRAVAPLNILLEYMIPFVKEGGYCICMKGTDIEEEVKNAKNAMSILGAEIEKTEKLSLTKGENSRSILIIKKNRKTENKYPRKAGTSKKCPL